MLVRVTLPVLVRVKVYGTTWPATVIWVVVEVFSMLRAGHATTTESLSLPLPSFVVVTEAEFSIVPQSPASVVPWMWTVQLWPAGRDGSVHVRTSGLGAVLMAQLTPVVLPVGTSAVQTIPAGRLSVTVIPRVVVVPVFETVISNPISPPT